MYILRMHSILSLLLPDWNMLVLNLDMGKEILHPNSTVLPDDVEKNMFSSYQICYLSCKYDLTATILHSMS